MSWIISLLLAGVLFTSEGDLPVNKHYNQKNSNIKKIVRLDETERFEQSYPLNPDGRVSISNINGSITVEAWDRNEVRLEAVKTADSRETLAEVELKIDARPERFSVETDYSNWKNKDRNNWKNKRLRVDFRLWVPRGANLNEIESVNGSIALSNFVNYTKASAVNGGIKASNLRGTAILSTVNGTTEADFDGVQSGSRISLSTVNGSVNLLVPSDINATVKADTVNGSINNDFGLPVRKGQYVGRDLYGRIGSGNAQIKLESVNGGLSIKRKNDGRNQNPAVNLLPSKSKDADVEWDDEKSVSVDSRKMNKEISKAVKEARKTSVKPVPKIEGNLIELPDASIAVEAVEIANEAITEANALINPAELQKKIKQEAQLNEKEIKEKFKQAHQRQKEIFARMRSANWMAPEMEETSDTLKVKFNPTVTIDAKNCSVAVRGWEKPEIKYSVRHISRNGFTDKNVSVKADNKESEVTITVDSESVGADQFNTNGNVRLEVFVPKKSNLRILSDREIRLEGVSGDIKLIGGDGGVNVRDTDGKLKVTTTDGHLRLIGFRGDLDAQSIDGAMSLDGEFENLSAKTLDGTIVLYVPDGSNFDIHSNHEIQADGISVECADDKKSSSKWKIGAGGGKAYSLMSGDGRIFVRGKSKLNSN